MRIPNDTKLLQTLLSPKAPALLPRRPSAAERSQSLRRDALNAFAHWGHLRCVELGRALWPSAKFPEQLAQRLVRRLQKDGLLLCRMNSVGTRSYVLTRPGAALAEGLGIDARHGLDLASVSGATFIHRSISTRYGIERQFGNTVAFGEHLLASSKFPLNRSKLVRDFGKLPDLLVITGGQIEWIEVESAAKSKGEIQKCLLLSKKCGRKIQDTEYHISRLIFVCDSRINHESRIVRAAKDLWSNFPPSERRQLSQNIWIVNVELGFGARWISMSEPKQIVF